MSYTPEEASEAIDFIKEMKITASLDPRDGKTLCFSRTPEIPGTFHEEIRSTLDICIEYHQRSVFTGEYLDHDSKPPIYRSGGDPLDEINFFLDYYKSQLIKEVEKGLDLYEPVFDEKRPKRKITPFAKVMLRHRAQDRKKNK